MPTNIYSNHFGITSIARRANFTPSKEANTAGSFTPGSLDYAKFWANKIKNQGTCLANKIPSQEMDMQSHHTKWKIFRKRVLWSHLFRIVSYSKMWVRIEQFTIPAEMAGIGFLIFKDQPIVIGDYSTAYNTPYGEKKQVEKMMKHHFNNPNNEIKTPVNSGFWQLTLI